MTRGVWVNRALAVLSALGAAVTSLGCIDLGRPPELVRTVDGRPRPRDAGPDLPSGSGSQPATAPDDPDADPPAGEPLDPDAGPPAGAPQGPDAARPGPDRPAAADVPRPDAPAADARLVPPQLGQDAGQPVGQDAGRDVGPIDSPTDVATDAAGPGQADRPAPDAPPSPLLVDNFTDGDPARNALGAPVASEQQVVTPANGELSFAWTGAGASQGFVESLLPGSCPTDLRGYNFVRFRLRASAPGKVVEVLIGRGSPDCSRGPVVRAGTVNPSPVMTTYMVNLASVAREAAGFLQWSPPLDGTVYTIDDIELIR